MKTTTAESWKDRAACKGADTDLFYLPGGETGAAAARTYEQIIRAWCRHCPVRLKCLDEAMRIEGALPASTRYGVWGGLSPQDRAALYRSTIGTAA